MKTMVFAQQTWNFVGTPLQQNITATAMIVDHGNKIYASYGGSLTEQSQVQRWNFVTWENIGYINSAYPINKIIVDNANNIYCIGAKDSIGRYFIGKWDGNSWSVLGNTYFGNPLKDIVTDGTNIFLAGDFTSTQNGQTYHINKWDGSEWSAYDIGSLNGAVSAMSIDKDGNLNVGGEFRTTNNKYGVKKKVGSSWEEVGSLQSNDPISRLLCDKLGNVYVSAFNNSTGKLSRYEPSNGNWRVLARREQAGFMDLKYVDNDNMVYLREDCGTPCQNLFRVYSNDSNEYTEQYVSYNRGAVKVFAKDNFGYLLIGSYEKNYNQNDYGIIKSSSVFMGTQDVSKKTVELYPNPIKDILNFSEEVSNIKITEVSGRAVKEISNSSKSINLQSLTKGVYIISATTKSGKFINQKIIKE